MKTYAWSMLSSLVLVSDFMMMERCVMEAVKRSPHQLVRIGGFKVQNREPLLRTCVYSRYAGSKKAVFRGFYRSWPTTGLAVDCRKTFNKIVFLDKEWRHKNLSAQQTKITNF